MATGPIQQPSVVPTAARPPAARRPVPPGDLSGLARALAVPAGEPRWRERFIVCLAPVRRGFAEHVRITEGPAGLYAEVVAQAPRLHRGVRLLGREHTAIVAALADLQHAVERPTVHAEELCRRVDELLRALARHRQHGADLLWQAYQTDLGGET
ncbi:hypothetical protein V6U81_18980 [Micromonospora sp. CPCC 205711]|uniref:hypothetical protein n=1 Tax=Micromonospora sp. CPCC 205547 TaxID=3122400 RepID=UPI002FF2362A